MRKNNNNVFKKQISNKLCWCQLFMFVRREEIFSILMAWGLKQLSTLLVRALMFLQSFPDSEGWLFLSWEEVWITLCRAEPSGQQSSRRWWCIKGVEGRSPSTFLWIVAGKPSLLLSMSLNMWGDTKLLTTSIKDCNVRTFSGQEPGGWYQVVRYIQLTYTSWWLSARPSFFPDFHTVWFCCI